jgi:DNA replication protein DnaC
MVDHIATAITLADILPPVPPGDYHAARAQQLNLEADLTEMKEMRERQAANRNKAYAKQRPAKYADTSYATLTEHQTHGGKIERWWDAGPRAVVLAGPARTGKTTAAYAITNDVHQRGIWTVVRTAADLSAALKPDSGEPLAYQHAVECDLLLIDDLGRERVTDWWLEQLQRIIDARCANGRRLITTTNHGVNATATYDDLAERYGYPVVERLIDDGTVLFFDGPAMRNVVREW